LPTEITQDAISKAERIMGKIDTRWPRDKVPGKTRFKSSISSDIEISYYPQ
jgi:hypothetical protein